MREEDRQGLQEPAEPECNPMGRRSATNACRSMTVASPTELMVSRRTCRENVGIFAEAWCQDGSVVFWSKWMYDGGQEMKLKDGNEEYQVSFQY